MLASFLFLQLFLVDPSSALCFVLISVLRGAQDSLQAVP
jgi:hypothetical protein